MFQIIRHDTNYPFTRLMKPALFLSAALILLSIGTVVDARRAQLRHRLRGRHDRRDQVPGPGRHRRRARGARPGGLRRRRDQALRQPERGADLDRAELDERRGRREGDPRRSRQPLERAVRRAAPRDGRPEGRRRPAQQGDLVADRLLGADARLHHLALRVQVRGRRHPRARARRHHLGRDLHAARAHLQPDGARRGADDRRLLDQRHDRHLRPDPRTAQEARASARSARSSTSR